MTKIITYFSPSDIISPLTHYILALRHFFSVSWRISPNLKKLHVNKAIRHLILMTERWNMVCHFLSYASMKQKKLPENIYNCRRYIMKFEKCMRSREYFFINFSYRVDILNRKWNSKGEQFTLSDSGFVNDLKVEICELHGVIYGWQMNIYSNTFAIS